MSCYNSKRLVEWLDSFVLSVEKIGYMKVQNRGFNDYGAHLHVWIKDYTSVEFRVSWHVLDTAARFSVDRELGVVKPPSEVVEWLLNAALDEHFDAWNSGEELPKI
jgi:hypothetical protein